MKRRTVQERFFSKVNAAQTANTWNGTPCHEWRGCIMPNGYGQFHLAGKTAYAHRVAWELQNGPIEDDSFVLHRCDNRRCCNPGHLFLGTFEDNMADMVTKRRQAHGRRNSHAKLSEAEVMAIRSATGTQAHIAAQFGVVQPLVSMIKSGRIWKQV